MCSFLDLSSLDIYYMQNKVVYVFSDEDECMELKSPTSSSPPEDEGCLLILKLVSDNFLIICLCLTSICDLAFTPDLLHEQSSDYGKNSKHHDCVQVCLPSHINWLNMLKSLEIKGLAVFVLILYVKYTCNL